MRGICYQRLFDIQPEGLRHSETHANRLSLNAIFQNLCRISQILHKKLLQSTFSARECRVVLKCDLHFCTVISDYSFFLPLVANPVPMNILPSAGQMPDVNLFFIRTFCY